ncbi:hypothetical protein CBR_g50627 [Chara braunii]|uniref:Tetratricopeptide repeat protein n=1 Tax=Chara braunii TaxID=69332 RepID=A0A388M7C0_CHABU|nr:hypothetical protein CBR_g50627 [Chara braunii]|eukprot:GBG90379.1 hypothetical protein CBR_g50627 [Chara braunii]
MNQGPWPKDSLPMDSDCAKLAEAFNILSMRLANDDCHVSYELLRRAEVLTQHPSSPAKLDGYDWVARPIEDASVRARLRAVTLNNMGCIQQKLGRPYTALRYLMSAMEIERRAHMAEKREGTLLNMCATLSQLGRHVEAREHAAAAVRILKGKKDGGLASTQPLAGDLLKKGETERDRPSRQQRTSKEGEGGSLDGLRASGPSGSDGGHGSWEDLASPAGIRITNGTRNGNHNGFTVHSRSGDMVAQGALHFSPRGSSNLGSNGNSQKAFREGQHWWGSNHSLSSSLLPSPRRWGISIAAELAGDTVRIKVIRHESRGEDGGCTSRAHRLTDHCDSPSGDGGDPWPPRHCHHPDGFPGSDNLHVHSRSRSSFKNVLIWTESSCGFSSSQRRRNNSRRGTAAATAREGSSGKSAQDVCLRPWTTPSREPPVKSFPAGTHESHLDLPGVRKRRYRPQSVQYYIVHSLSQALPMAKEENRVRGWLCQDDNDDDNDSHTDDDAKDILPSPLVHPVERPACGSIRGFESDDDDDVTDNSPSPSLLPVTMVVPVSPAINRVKSANQTSTTGNSSPETRLNTSVCEGSGNCTAGTAAASAQIASASLGWMTTGRLSGRSAMARRISASCPPVPECDTDDETDDSEIWMTSRRRMVTASPAADQDHPESRARMVWTAGSLNGHFGIEEGSSEVMKGGASGRQHAPATTKRPYLPKTPRPPLPKSSPTLTAVSAHSLASGNAHDTPLPPPKSPSSIGMQVRHPSSSLSPSAPLCKGQDVSSIGHVACMGLELPPSTASCSSRSSSKSSRHLPSRQDQGNKLDEKGKLQGLTTEEEKLVPSLISAGSGLDHEADKGGPPTRNPIGPGCHDESEAEDGDGGHREGKGVRTRPFIPTLSLDKATKVRASAIEGARSLRRQIRSRARRGLRTAGDVHPQRDSRYCIQGKDGGDAHSRDTIREGGGGGGGYMDGVFGEAAESNSGRELSSSKGLDVMLVIALHNLAVEHEFLGELPQAYVSYNRAFALAKSVWGKRSGMARFIRKSLSGFKRKHRRTRTAWQKTEPAAAIAAGADRPVAGPDLSSSPGRSPSTRAKSHHSALTRFQCDAMPASWSSSPLGMPVKKGNAISRPRAKHNNLTLTPNPVPNGNTNPFDRSPLTTIGHGHNNDGCCCYNNSEHSDGISSDNSGNERSRRHRTSGSCYNVASHGSDWDDERSGKVSSPQERPIIHQGEDTARHHDDDHQQKDLAEDHHDHDGILSERSLSVWNKSWPGSPVTGSRDPFVHHEPLPQHSRKSWVPFGYETTRTTGEGHRRVMTAGSSSSRHRSSKNAGYSTTSGGSRAKGNHRSRGRGKGSSVQKLFSFIDLAAGRLAEWKPSTTAVDGSSIENSFLRTCSGYINDNISSGNTLNIMRRKERKTMSGGEPGYGGQRSVPALPLTAQGLARRRRFWDNAVMRIYLHPQGQKRKMAPR